MAEDITYVTRQVNLPDFIWEGIDLYADHLHSDWNEIIHAGFGAYNNIMSRVIEGEEMDDQMIEDIASFLRHQSTTVNE